MLREAMGGISQMEAERKSGVRQALISRYLRGQGEPTLANLAKLERAFPKLAELRARPHSRPKRKRKAR